MHKLALITTIGSRGICNDPNVYPNPSQFQPERFMGEKPEPDPEFMFGFGRRKCKRVIAWWRQSCSLRISRRSRGKLCTPVPVRCVHDVSGDVGYLESD